MKSFLALLVAAPLAAQSPPTFTLAQFKSLSWLEGSWRGSGGAYPSFFEDYRMINDSTMRMRSLKDSTFTVASDSSDFLFRNGRITKGSSAITKITRDTIRLDRVPAAPGRGYTFVRTSPTTWTAILESPSGAPTIYQMKKVAGK
jgi:hypothetical protein